MTHTAATNPTDELPVYILPRLADRLVVAMRRLMNERKISDTDAPAISVLGAGGSLMEIPVPELLRQYDLSKALGEPLSHRFSDALLDGFYRVCVAEKVLHPDRTAAPLAGLSRSKAAKACREALAAYLELAPPADQVRRMRADATDLRRFSDAELQAFADLSFALLELHHLSLIANKQIDVAKVRNLIAKGGELLPELSEQARQVSARRIFTERRWRGHAHDGQPYDAWVQEQLQAALTRDQ